MRGDDDGSVTPRKPGSVLVLGEALCDLVIDVDGSVTSALGGAPYNTARALGRLCVPTEFASPISTDRFGELLAASLTDAGVDIARAARTEAPTTLAAATLSVDGSASYRFYVEGTSILDVTPIEVGDGPVAAMTGGLALALPKVARSIESLLDSGLPLFLDVNCRPALIDDRSAFLDRVHRFAARSDLVKISDEDARWMADPGTGTGGAVEQIVDELLNLGARAVVVTAGGDSVLVATASGRAQVEVPAVEVVDTIGAGDAFDAGLIAYWIRAGADREALGNLELLTSAVGAGVAVSAMVCGRRGADPPRLSQLADELWP